MNNRAPIAVLISGRGSNMQALIERSRDSSSAYQVTQVLSDNPSAAGLGIARDLGVEARALPADPAQPRAAYDRLLAAAIDRNPPKLVVLAGFMRILSQEFVERFAGRIVNIHPSLLPKYPGLHTHRKALAAADAVHGATVHFVTAELDGGPPIVQAQVPVLPGDDEASLQARVTIEEHRIYPLAVGWFCEGRLQCRNGLAWLDGNALTEPVRCEDSAALCDGPIARHP